MERVHAIGVLGMGGLGHCIPAHSFYQQSLVSPWMGRNSAVDSIDVVKYGRDCRRRNRFQRLNRNSELAPVEVGNNFNGTDLIIQMNFAKFYVSNHDFVIESCRVW